MRHYTIPLTFLLATAMAFLGHAQEKSVNPGINDSFKNPDVKKYKNTFEGESREVYAQREKIIAACDLKPGMVVADIGAGTGLHTRLFSKAVGENGQVYAVDISSNFLQHIQKTVRQEGMRNVTPVLCNEDSVDLPKAAVDLAFVCDTYHHFEFPQRTLASLHRAIKPGGKLVIVDFKRIEGVSSEWTLKHVRAGQEIVEKEISGAGFTKTAEVGKLLNDNYFVIFTRSNGDQKTEANESKPSSGPVVPGFGRVVPLDSSLEPPTKGTKVVIDVTGIGKDKDPAPGLVRAATLLNLAGSKGMNPTDLKVSVVLHGDATALALDDQTFQSLYNRPNPSSGLLVELQKAGVSFQVCGQSLARKNLDATKVRKEVNIAMSAITSLINHQSRGFAYIPAH